MNKKHLGCAALGLLLWWPAVVLGQSTSSPFARPEPRSVDVAYEGTLICFRCDVAPSPENRTRCTQEGHVPLLRRAEGYTHTLVGSTNAITAKLASEELHGKKIKVKGIYYPKTNQLLVEQVLLLER